MGEGAWRTLWRESRAGQWRRQPKGGMGEDKAGGDRGKVTLPRRVAARGELQSLPIFFGSQEMRGVGCPLLIHSFPGWMWFAVAEALLG